MREYELMVIVDPEAEDAQVESVLERITGIVAGDGGEMTSVDRWGKRKLAYEIDKKTEGHYLVLGCRAESKALAELDRVLRLADEVLRFKILVKAA